MAQEIQRVKEATDIVAIIGERLTLSRAGRNMKALCPFHSEKSPSFFVSPEIQTYTCFGCGEKGDVLTFLQKYDGMTFGESLQYLADRAGIKIEKFQKSDDDNLKDRLLTVLELAAKYYHYLFTTHKYGETARTYLKDRHVSNDSIKQFQIGYSPPAWDGLIKYLVGKKKHPILDLEAAGLVIPRKGGTRGSTNPRDYYDRFRDRIMFPLTDHRGRIVGFSGRVLNPEEKEAKYINTPETLLYHKSKMLFGFSQNYQTIRAEKNVIVVEGEFDVISSTQAHVMNVAAIKGSALTEEHVQLLKRTVETITLSLDADSAGIEATKRAIHIIHRFDDIRLRVIPGWELEGKDPDELAHENPSKWRALVKQSMSAYQFFIESAKKKFDLSTGEGKQQAVREVGPVISSIPHAVERQHYINMFAKVIGVSELVLQQDLERMEKKSVLRTSNIPAAQPKEEKEDQAAKIEQETLSMLLQFPDSNIPKLSAKLKSEFFAHPAYRRIIQELQQTEKYSPQTFVAKLSPELQEPFAGVFLQADLGDIPDDKLFHQMQKGLENASRQRQLDELSHQLQQLEETDSESPEKDAEMEKLLGEIVALRSQMDSGNN